MRLCSLTRFVAFLVFVVPATRLAAQEGVDGVATGVGNRFIQLNTPLTNDKNVFEAVITHRFNQAVKDGGGGSFFGIDSGAAIGLGLEYTPLTNVAVQIYRVSALQDYEFAAKVTLLRPTKELPFSLGVRGGLNWITAPYLQFLGSQKQSGGFGQVLVAVTLFDRVTLAAAPSYVQRTPYRTNVWNVPVMGQLKITRSIALIGEFVPKKDVAPNSTYQWAAMLEKRVYHHRFALSIGNTIASTMDQLMGGDFGGAVTDKNIHLGFNILREFDFTK